MAEGQDWIIISPHDNVAVALNALSSGVVVGEIKAAQDIPAGHKIALKDLDEGAEVLKYGYPIGRLTAAVKAGEHIHTHNLKTGLEGTLDYEYRPVSPAQADASLKGRSFMGYPRSDGRTGTRNELWIIPTVGCVNKTAEALARRMEAEAEGRCDGIYAYTHPFGCSQLGEDHENTRTILADLVKHPNAGGVLVLGLGCENNTIDGFKEKLNERGGWDEERVRFLITQESEDELAEGCDLIRQILKTCSEDRRESRPVSELVVGMKCGGSDGLSGITANPLVGLFSDALVGAGGTSILTEVPEMFGAETILMNRCRDAQVFDKTVSLINGFKDYFSSHGQTVYENPSPGNKDGGITTLEDKSLGCIQKGGRAPVSDVLSYGDRVEEKGLVLLNGPGNDIVSTTAMTAAGATVILFTTGRGTPLGAPLPTLKISTNSTLARHKRSWIDFDAGPAAEGRPLEELKGKLAEKIIAVASGEPSRNEMNSYREISIFKDGVVL